MLQQGLGTLDNRIDKQANVLRANPQAMGKEQQKQKADIGKGVTPDLMNALALQKVASEKAMAENQLRLSMEQSPATIVEQLEQNAMARTKDDLVKQTAGILGERDKKRKQQMSPAKPPQQGQRPPMPQGAPAGLRAAPRPPMQMANGGIIGYQRGGVVSDRMLKAIGMDRESFEALPDKVQKTLMESASIPTAVSGIKDAFSKPTPTTIEGFDAAIDSMQNRVNAAPPLARDSLLQQLNKLKAGKAALPPQDQTKDSTTQSVDTPPPPPPAGIAEQQAKTPVPIIPKTLPDMGGLGVLAPQAGPQAQPSVDQQLQDVLDTPAPDTSGIDRTQLSTALGDEFMGKLDTRMDINPIEERDKELARLASDDAEKGGFGVKKYQEGLAEYLNRQKEEDARQLDPEALRKARAAAGVRGLIEGGTGRGASIARGKFDENVAKRRRDIITEQRATYVDNETKKNAVIKDINTDAAKLFDTYTKDVAAAMNTMANVTKGDLEMYQKEADRMYQSNQNGIKNKIDAIRVSGEAKLRELVQKQASLQDIASAIQGLKDKNNDLRTQYEKALQPEMQRLNSIIFDKDSSADEVTLARSQLVAIETRYQALKDKTSTDEFMKIYKEFLLQLKAQGGYTNQLRTQLQQTMKDTLGNSSSTQADALTGSAQARADAIVPPPPSP